MDDLIASKTALATCRMRAIHTRQDAQPILDDPWGDILVTAPIMREMVQAISGTLGIDTTGLPDEEIETLTDDYLQHIGVCHYVCL